MEKVIWRPIKGYEGLYEVSNTGLIKSLNCYNYKEPKILQQYVRKDGYAIVGLSKNNITKTKTVHRLVAEAFLPNPNDLEMVNHRDENKSNNNVDNLEWCSRAYNQIYSLKLHPERNVQFYNNFLDENGNSNSPMLISEARVRTEPVAHLGNDLKILKIYDNWVEAKKDIPFTDYGIYETCKRNMNKKNTKKKNYIRKHKGEIFVFLDDELIVKNPYNKKLVEEYKQ